jgi:hypothetical protein
MLAEIVVGYRAALQPLQAAADVVQLLLAELTEPGSSPLGKEEYSLISKV